MKKTTEKLVATAAMLYLGKQALNAIGEAATVSKDIVALAKFENEHNFVHSVKFEKVGDISCAAVSIKDLNDRDEDGNVAVHTACIRIGDWAKLLRNNKFHVWMADQWRPIEETRIMCEDEDEVISKE